jgi:hypothetical protein
MSTQGLAQRLTRIESWLVFERTWRSSRFMALLREHERMLAPSLTIPTAGSRRGNRAHSVWSLASMFVIALVSSCGGGEPDTFTGPETLKITALSPESITGKMGDLVSVSLRVTALNGGDPPFGTKVAFAPSDGGTVSVTPYALPNTDAQVTWRLGPTVKSQTLTATVDGARPFVFRATVTDSA